MDFLPIPLDILKNKNLTATEKIVIAGFMFFINGHRRLKTIGEAFTILAPLLGLSAESIKKVFYKKIVGNFVFVHKVDNETYFTYGMDYEIPIAPVSEEDTELLCQIDTKVSNRHKSVKSTQKCQNDTNLENGSGSGIERTLCQNDTKKETSVKNQATKDLDENFTEESGDILLYNNNINNNNIINNKIDKKKINIISYNLVAWLAQRMGVKFVNGRPPKRFVDRNIKAARELLDTYTPEEIKNTVDFILRKGDFWANAIYKSGAPFVTVAKHIEVWYARWKKVQDELKPTKVDLGKRDEEFLRNLREKFKTRINGGENE